jgi:hypothetical protein
VVTVRRMSNNYYNHLYNTIIIIIRHPSYCYDYNVINISPITPHIYIIHLWILLAMLLTVSTIMYRGNIYNIIVVTVRMMSNKNYDCIM